MHFTELPVKVADRDEDTVARVAGSVIRVIGRSGMDRFVFILNRYLNSINYPKNKSDCCRDFGFRVRYHRLLQEENLTELPFLRFEDNKFSIPCLQSVDFGANSGKQPPAGLDIDNSYAYYMRIVEK